MPRKRLSFGGQSYISLNASPKHFSYKILRNFWSPHRGAGVRPLYIRLHTCTSESLINRLDDIQDKFDYQRTSPARRLISRTTKVRSPTRSSNHSKQPRKPKPVLSALPVNPKDDPQTESRPFSIKRHRNLK